MKTKYNLKMILNRFTNLSNIWRWSWSTMAKKQQLWVIYLSAGLPQFLIALARLAEHCLAVPLVLEIVSVGVKNIILILFSYFMRYLIKKYLNSILFNYLEGKYGLINIYIFKSFFFVFFFIITFLFISISTNVIYLDSVVSFTANDIDVEVSGSFVEYCKHKYGSKYAFIKSLTVAGSLMKIVSEAPNLVESIPGSTQQVIQRGIFIDPEKLAAGRKTLKLAYEIKKDPIPLRPNPGVYPHWEIKLIKISNPTNELSLPRNIRINKERFRGDLYIEHKERLPLDQFFHKRPKAFIEQTWDNRSGHAAVNWVDTLINQG